MLALCYSAWVVAVVGWLVMGWSGQIALLAGFGGWDALPDSLVGLGLAGWLPLLVLVA